jgi:hypothetical protein
MEPPAYWASKLADTAYVPVLGILNVGYETTLVVPRDSVTAGSSGNTLATGSDPPPVPVQYTLPLDASFTLVRRDILFPYTHIVFSLTKVQATR